MLAFKPKNNEILDGVVHNVNKDGIEVFSGPIKCFIKVDVSFILFFNNFYREWEVAMNMTKLQISLFLKGQNSSL